MELDFGVARERALDAEDVDLDRMVDHEIDRDERIDFRRVAAEALHRRAQRRQVHDRGDAGEILQDHAGGQEGNVGALGSLWRPGGERGDILFLDQPAIAIADDRFEQDPDRKREARNAAEPGLFERREAVDGRRAGGCFERGARVKGDVVSAWRLFRHCVCPLHRMETRR